tara:strand:- start:139 stop:453 length:315 start_codon:yes stop_codon:yes gene_type:complete
MNTNILSLLITFVMGFFANQIVEYMCRLVEGAEGNGGGESPTPTMDPNYHESPTPTMDPNYHKSALSKGQLIGLFCGGFFAAAFLFILCSEVDWIDVYSHLMFW